MIGAAAGVAVIASGLEPAPAIGILATIVAVAAFAPLALAPPPAREPLLEPDVPLI